MAMADDKKRDKVLKTRPQPIKKPVPGSRDAARGKAKAEEGRWLRPELKTKKP